MKLPALAIAACVAAGILAGGFAAAYLPHALPLCLVVALFLLLFGFALLALGRVTAAWAACFAGNPRRQCYRSVCHGPARPYRAPYAGAAGYAPTRCGFLGHPIRH